MGVLALLGKVGLLAFWLVVGIAWLYVRYVLPRLREREAAGGQKP
jgi:hypothetical protein